MDLPLETRTLTVYHCVEVRELSDMKHIVELSSEEYGSEQFLHDSRREALAGIARLAEECARGHRVDGIVRRIAFLIGETPDEFAEREEKTGTFVCPKCASDEINELTVCVVSHPVRIGAMPENRPLTAIRSSIGSRIIPTASSAEAIPKSPSNAPTAWRNSNIPSATNDTSPDRARTDAAIHNQQSARHVG
jgi:hypothetical protein